MENQQPPMSLNNVPSKSTCPKPLVDNQISTVLVARSSPVLTTDTQIKTEDERTEEYEMMVPKLTQSKKQNYKMFMDARIHNLISPKSAFMVFSELFQGIQVKLQKHPENAINCKSYTASLEIDGQIYTANDISTSGASEKACEKFLRNMLVKKISKLSEKKEKSSKEKKMEDKENYTVDYFPWEQFIKLAMHNLIIQWKIQNASEVFKEETMIEY